MRSKNTPEMTTLETGNTFKVLQVNGNNGMNMPEHYSTKEAVVIVQKGRATLRMNNADHLLKFNDSIVVPAGMNHELRITEDFQAVVIMESDSDIKFITT